MRLDSSGGEAIGRNIAFNDMEQAIRIHQKQIPFLFDALSKIAEEGHPIAIEALKNFPRQ